MDNFYDKIIDLVKNSISDIKDSYIQFSDPNYKPFNLSKDNFHEIKNSISESKIAFIDGGSSEIIKSSNFSLSLIRVYYVIYQQNKRISSKKYDFYSFIKTKNIDDELYFDVEFIGENYEIVPNKNDLLLSSFDETLKQGISRANISNMSNVIRRFSEIILSEKVIDELQNNDIIVLDGSLQCTFTNENKYFEQLYKKALEKGILITGLSKTTKLMTDRGSSISNALNKFDPTGKWIYHPVAEIKTKNHQSEMAFVKLHEKSKYIFRFEVYKEQRGSMEKTIRLISNNCKDSVFIGYPYGLIEADRNARISNNERYMLLTYFSTKFGKDWEKIKESVSNIDAHEILDKI